MINWIDENLGTGSFDAVKENGIYKLDVRDMVDKSGNDENIIVDKINEAVSEIGKGKKVVICCDYGISRSNGIAIGVYSIIKNIDFFKAASFVTEKAGNKEIKPEIISAVYKALNQGRPVICQNSSNIFISGATGFIGRKLCPLLSRTCNIYAPSSKEINLLDDSALLDLYVKKNGISTIVHLANPKIYNSAKAMGDTLVMLKNILTVCGNNDTHLIYMSGWEVYSGYASHFLLASENLPLFAKGVYGETKYLCESLIKNAARENPLKYTIVRAGPVYGIGSERPKFIYNFIDKAVKNQQISVHRYINGLPCLDLLYIDDLADILAKIVVSKETGDFNIGTGKLTSTTDIAELITRKTSAKSAIKTIDILSYCPNVAMDITKAAKTFDWKPATDAETGINRIIEELNENQHHRT